MLGILLTAALSAPVYAGERFSWDPLLDTTLALAGPALYGLLYTQVETSMPPGDLGGEPGGFDAWVPPHYSAGLASASNLVLYGSMAGGVAAAALDGRLSGESVGPRIGIMSQTLALDLLITDTWKLAISRPRPYTRIADPDAQVQALLSEPDATRSFPSGHASGTAAATFAWARMTQLSGTVSPALSYPLAGALTATAAIMRVAAGVHYPSDVLAGALIGASVGVLVPSLHVVSTDSAGLITVGGRW